LTRSMQQWKAVKSSSFLGSKSIDQRGEHRHCSRGVSLLMNDF
jgi:hypothetical protein